jgi:hypothetical protein
MRLHRLKTGATPTFAGALTTPFLGLSSPWTHPPHEVRFTRALPARHLPPSGFGYPLDGLLPRAACRPCFMPAAPVGFFLRSLLLAAGSLSRYRECSPRFPLPQAELDRPKSAQPRPEARIPGTSCLQVPCHSSRVFSPTPCRVLPWDSPLPGIAIARLGDRFRPPPPSRLLPAMVAHDGSPRLGVSINGRLARLREPGVPHRVWHLNLPGVRSFARPGL